MQVVDGQWLQHSSRSHTLWLTGRGFKSFWVLCFFFSTRFPVNQVPHRGAISYKHIFSCAASAEASLVRTNWAKKHLVDKFFRALWQWWSSNWGNFCIKYQFSRWKIFLKADALQYPGKLALCWPKILSMVFVSNINHTPKREET